MNLNIPGTRGIECAKLSVEHGLSVRLLDYGATIQSIVVPVRGRLIEAVLGYIEPADYLSDPYYLGSTVGRYAGRIASGQFELEGRVFRLDRNETGTGHCLHGGARGFSRQFWSRREPESSRSACYEYRSADGEQGFPGNLQAQIDYTLTGPLRLQIDYRAETDAATVVNLTNHAYFNLSGDGEFIGAHEISIRSEQFLPLGEDLIPSGEVRAVENSAFDLRQKTELAGRLSHQERQLQIALGFDHFFLLDGAGTAEPAATLRSPGSGLGLNFYTTHPGVQFYTGNSLGAPFVPRSGLCLEFQNAPNAPNETGFPSPLLSPGVPYHHRIVLEFECD